MTGTASRRVRKRRDEREPSSGRSDGHGAGPRASHLGSSLQPLFDLMAEFFLYSRPCHYREHHSSV